MDSTSNKIDFIKQGKGIAILLIVFHHLARTLSDFKYQHKPPLNQWRFESFDIPDTNNISDFFLIQLPGEFFYAGVGMFVFISGIGMHMKFNSSKSNLSFILNSVIKLIIPFYLTLALVSVAWYALKAEVPFNFSDILRKIFFIGYTHRESMFIVNSPLWCYDIFIVLYLLVPVIKWFESKFTTEMVLVISTLISTTTSLLTHIFFFQNNEMYYVPGAFPINYLQIFVFGMYFHKLFFYQKVLYFALSYLCFGILYFLFNSIFPAYNLVFFTTSILALLLLFLFSNQFKFIKYSIASIGSLSLAVLLCHRPIINLFPKIYYVVGDYYLSIGIVLIIIVIASSVYYPILTKIKVKVLRYVS